MPYKSSISWALILKSVQLELMNYCLLQWFCSPVHCSPWASFDFHCDLFVDNTSQQRHKAPICHPNNATNASRPLYCQSVRNKMGGQEGRTVSNNNFNNECSRGWSAGENDYVACDGSRVFVCDGDSVWRAPLWLSFKEEQQWGVWSPRDTGLRKIPLSPFLHLKLT